MSEPTQCSGCGQTYGASWGDVSGTCHKCESKQAREQKLRQENWELRQKIKELESRLPTKQPKFIGESI